jgi:hypothetical protein
MYFRDLFNKGRARENVSTALSLRLRPSFGLCDNLKIK